MRECERPVCSFRLKTARGFEFSLDETRWSGNQAGSVCSLELWAFLTAQFLPALLKSYQDGFAIQPVPIRARPYAGPTSASRLRHA